MWRRPKAASIVVDGKAANIPSDTFSDTYASGATAPHLKEVLATEMATDEPKTRPVVWAGQLFIKGAGWRTETMTATSNDTVAALKTRMQPFEIKAYRGGTPTSYTLVLGTGTDERRREIASSFPRSGRTLLRKGTDRLKGMVTGS